MNLAYYGEKGAYTHMSTLNIIDYLNLGNSSLEINNDKLLARPGFKELWNSINDEESFIIFPFENSYAGNVTMNLYKFMKYDVEIYAEYTMPINHCLLYHGYDESEIHTVLSHHQSIMQCNEFIEDNKLKTIDAGDNGLAAKRVSEEKVKGEAAIASKIAGNIFGLNILKEGIQDQKGNKTKFLIVGKKGDKDLKKEITDNIKLENNKSFVSLLFAEKKDTPSFLYNCLGAFSNRGINLTKIESLPSYQEAFSYYFWITLEGSLEDSNVKEGLKDLKKYSNDIRVLGSYKEIII